MHFRGGQSCGGGSCVINAVRPREAGYGRGQGPLSNDITIRTGGSLQGPVNLQIILLSTLPATLPILEQVEYCLPGDSASRSDELRRSRTPPQPAPSMTSGNASPTSPAQSPPSQCRTGEMYCSYN